MPVFIMDDYDSESEEIDLLVRELMAPGLPLLARQAASQPPGPPGPAQPPVAQPVESEHVQRRPGSRWTNVRLLMPSRRTPGVRKRFALGSVVSLQQLPALSLPKLPALGRLIRMPATVTMVRLWVALGAAHSASMTFWPYPKTYYWGLVLYLLSLGLVLVTGIWGARLSWEARLGAAHTVALGTVLWAVTLATAETLPLI